MKKARYTVLQKKKKKKKSADLHLGQSCLTNDGVICICNKDEDPDCEKKCYSTSSTYETTHKKQFSDRSVLYKTAL